MDLEKLNEQIEKVRGIPLDDAVWNALDERAKANGRAACREAAHIIKNALGYTASVQK